MSVRWIKYGTQSDIRFSMVKRGVVDLAVSADWTPAAADSAISKDGGNLADTTNTVAVVSSGTATRSGVDWKLTISATEAQAAEINIQIVDAATKAVEDQFLTVYTYGNASAKFAGDWSDIVRLGLTGLANAVPGAAGGLLIAGTNTATTFAGVAAAGATPATAGLTVTGGAASTTGGGVAAAAIVVTGGAGAASTNGAASGATFAGGGTNTVASTADGIKATGTSTGHGLDAQSGAGATGNGINAVSNATNGSGATLTKAGSGNDLNATSTPLVLAKTTNITGFNDIAATAVVSAGAITTSGGAVSTVTTVTNRVTANVDQIDGAALTAHAAGKMPADVLTIAGTAQTGLDLGGTWTAARAAHLDADISSRMATYTQPTGFLAATFPNGTIANTTNITAGTITTTTNLTNAATAGDLTATMKTSVENAVWDATMASHVTAGSTGAALNAAGGAGDPWITALPGAYAAGSAGFIIGTNLNAKVGDVKLQTDKLTFTVANKLDVNVLYVNGTAVTGAGTAANPWGPL
jgi:hypothetical protein